MNGREKEQNIGVRAKSPASQNPTELTKDSIQNQKR